MGIKDKLSKEIKNQFPRVIKTDDYANLILEGKKLKAVNKINAKKRKYFLDSDIVSESIFTSSYSRLGLLNVIENADKTIAVSSTRHSGFAFSHSMILSRLNYERHLLYKRMRKDFRIKKIICSILKISIQSSTETLQRKMEQGSPYQQVELYKKIFKKIKSNGIFIECMWLGVVQLPASLYYLSDLSNLLLHKVK